MDLLVKPIRLAYTEELGKEHLDKEFLKDFVDGKKISCEILFGTDTTKPIQAKLMTCGNEDYNGKTDAGLRRRGLVQTYDSVFLPEPKEGETYKFSDENHIYRRIDGYDQRFISPEYKNAYFHLLVNYVDKLAIPKINEDQFKAVCDENDFFKKQVIRSL